MKTQTVMEKDQDFDSQLSDCIDRALFILSTSQKKFLLLRLEDDYGLPSADFGKHPEKLEAALKRILGETVTATILDKPSGLLHFVQESVVFRRQRHSRTGYRSAGQLLARQTAERGCGGQGAGRLQHSALGRTAA